MSNHKNKQKKRPPRRSPRQANTVRFPLPFVMLLCWMRSYTGDEECSCGASPDYEIDSFVDAEGLLEADGPGERSTCSSPLWSSSEMVPLRSIKPSWSAGTRLPAVHRSLR